MDNRKFGAFSSSEDPQKLGDTIKALIIAASVGIIFIGHALGFEIGTESITQFAMAAGTAVSSVWFIFGVLKKIIVAVTKRS